MLIHSATYYLPVLPRSSKKSESAKFNKNKQTTNAVNLVYFRMIG